MNPDRSDLSSRVESVLERRGARFETVAHGDATEPWIEFRLILPPERRLEVRLVVSPDVFAFQANQAQMKLERVDFGDEDETWFEGCLGALEALMDTELTIRVRRTLIGGSLGAVRVPGRETPDSWNGDLLACLGFGKERTFAQWWSPPA